MNRRELLRRLGAGVAATLITPLVAAAPVRAAEGVAAPLAEGPAQAPNVVLITIDDLNDWIGCMGGHPQVQTPNIDRLAQRGMLFTNAHCAAPMCNPSRAALLSGLSPMTSGVVEAQNLVKVMPGVITLPHHFKEHGYLVQGAGKVFHDTFPDPSAWHDYFPTQLPSRPLDPTPPVLPANTIPDDAYGYGGNGYFDWGPVDVPDEAMGDAKVVQWAIDRLHEEVEAPRFLGVGLFRPHAPMYAPRSYFDLYPSAGVILPTVPDDDLDDLPPRGKWLAAGRKRHQTITAYGQWPAAVTAYLACVTFADAMVGRLLNAIESSPAAGNTIIVLLGDNGWHLGEKRSWEKAKLWEESTHVPLIIAAPGFNPAQRRCSRPVSLLDVYPTLVELCALPPKPELEGQSLAPLLANPETAWVRPAVTFYRPYDFAVRSERFRYIRYHDGGEELYDHAFDPGEWTNLAADDAYAAIKQELEGWLPPPIKPQIRLPLVL